MTSNSIGIVIGACLVLLHQGIRAQFLYYNCGLYDTAGPRIMNGKDATQGSAPFMAYVMKNNVYHCGGSIVNHRYILTAAHCLDVGLSVRLGEHNDLTNPDCDGMVCAPPYEHFDIEVVAYHREYNKVNQANDIALLRVNRDIIFNKNIQPICLYRDPDTAPAVTDYRAFGWGYTNGYGNRAHVLQTTNLNLFDNQDCENQLRTLTSNHICVGAEDSDTCRGDSGSPLVTEITTSDGQDRYVQFGIVSFGNLRCTGAGAYTYVPNYGPWIGDKMRFLDERQRARARNYFSVRNTK